jgi:hypothetical protein
MMIREVLVFSMLCEYIRQQFLCADSWNMYQHELLTNMVYEKTHSRSWFGNFRLCELPRATQISRPSLDPAQY